jgi:hypothetical protein
VIDFEDSFADIYDVPDEVSEESGNVEPFVETLPEDSEAI